MPDFPTISNEESVTHIDVNGNRVSSGRDFATASRDSGRQHSGDGTVGFRRPLFTSALFTLALSTVREAECASYVESWLRQIASKRELSRRRAQACEHRRHALRRAVFALKRRVKQRRSIHYAQRHLIHATEFPEFDYMLPARISSESKKEYRGTTEEHIDRQLASPELPLPAQVHFVIEPPDVAITKCVERPGVNLLVMGTVGRTGISGFITGNLAERLLPRIPCSLLAVKPPGFKLPIVLERRA